VYRTNRVSYKIRDFYFSNLHRFVLVTNKNATDINAYFFVDKTKRRIITKSKSDRQYRFLTATIYNMMKYTDDAMNIYLGNYFLAKKLKNGLL